MSTNDDGFPDGNGNVLRERIAWLRHRIRGLEEGTKLLAELGAKGNEQTKVHDEQLRELDRRLNNMEAAVKDVPILHERVDAVIAALTRARTAGWGAAASFLILAATIILKGAP